MDKFLQMFDGSPKMPYVIAEIGVNHEGDLSKAKHLIDLAAKAGAACVKFQTYKAGDLALPDSPSYWDTSEETLENQYQLFSKFDGLTDDDYVELANYAREQSIDFASTPFSLPAVDLLAPLMPFIKIASADITNVPLLRKAASKRMPIVLSTGASNMEEIAKAVSELDAHGATHVAIMHCVLNYPTSPENANLAMISSLREAYPERVMGYSDHTKADERLTALETAVSMGAFLLEKHFTDDKFKSGNDHYHSMDASDLRLFVERMESWAVYRGSKKQKEPLASEEGARNFARRSIVSAEAIKAGEIIEARHLECKRPGIGISPTHWDDVLGKKAARNIEKNVLVDWNMFEGA